MKTMSISLTLGKASSAHGANIAHNNRDFISDNVDENMRAMQTLPFIFTVSNPP